MTLCSTSLPPEDDMPRKRLQLKGNLVEDGNWWRVRWWEDARGADGVVRRMRKSAIIAPCRGPGRLSRKQAQQKAWDDVLCHVNAKVTSPASVMTVEQFVAQKFIPEVVWALKPASKKDYDYKLSKLIPALGGVRLCDMDSGKVQAWLRKMVEEGYSPQTVTHMKNAVSAVFTHAKRVGYFHGENPARLVKLPPLTRVKQRTALTVEQAQKVLDRLPSPVKEMALLAMTTSLNVAELCGLRWKRVNLTSGFVVVDGDVIPPLSLTVRENYYEGEFGTVKTGKRNRIQPIPAVTVPLLEKLKQRDRFTGPEDVVFANRNGKPVDAHNVNNRVFKKIGKELGIPLSWHVFRHTCATLTEIAGMPKADRIALMGHAGAEMTDYYTHSDIERRRTYVDNIAGELVAVPVEKEEKGSTVPTPTAEDLQKLWDLDSNGTGDAPEAHE